MSFWGLQLEPGKHYSQNVSKAFHITHAVIGREGSSPIVDWLVAVRAIVNDSDYILCYLGCAKGTVMLQQPLSLEVAEGEEVVLYTQPVNDNCKDRYFVHLTGYYEDDLYEPTESEIMDAAFDNELDESYEVPGIENGVIDDDNDHEEEDNSEDKSDDEDGDEEIEDDNENKLSEIPTPGKKRANSSSILSKKDKKRKKEPTTKSSSSTKKTKVIVYKTKGGTEVKEIEEGDGGKTQVGKRVFVKYTGRLASNNRIFDSNVDKRRPFVFRLGRGEVIKGWDEGLLGMKVGGKRKLTVPSKQGYGMKGAPPQIPPNSTLVFDVELTGVK